MKISNQLSDIDRHYISNLLVSQAGEVPDSEGNVSKTATHRFIIEDGFIVGAEKIVRIKNVDKKEKVKKEIKS